MATNHPSLMHMVAFGEESSSIKFVETTKWISIPADYGMDP